MYEAFYGFERRPFSAVPDPGCFLCTEGAQAALDELLICAERGQGIGVLTAPPGTGKTLLCERLVQELSPAACPILIRHASFSDRRDLLQALLYELRRPYARMSDQELRLELASVLKTLRTRKQAVVLICDEAHLFGEPLLEELRTMTDVAEKGVPVVRLVLSGQLPLEETLARPSLLALNQRIRAQVALQSLTHAESAKYLAHHVTRAGADLQEVFDPAAVDLICHVSDGVPRCLNQLSDHGLLLGYVNEQKPVSVETVRQAFEDLRQLPLHWNEPLAGVHPATAPDDPPWAAPELEAGDDQFAVEFGPQESIEVGADRDELTSDRSLLGATTSLAEQPAAADEEPTTNCEADVPVDEDAISPESSDHEPRCLPPSQPVSSALNPEDIAHEFEEQLVIDRYAALDAGLAPPIIEVPERESHTELQPAPEPSAPLSIQPEPATGESMPVVESVEDKDLAKPGRPLETIDRLMPLLGEPHQEQPPTNAMEAIETDEIENDSSLSIVDDDSNEYSNGHDEQLAGDILDACLSMQQSLLERVVDVREGELLIEPQARPSQPETEPETEPDYDVVQPEPPPPRRTPHPQIDSEHVSPPPPAGHDRTYRNLFSRLRRRQQSLD